MKSSAVRELVELKDRLREAVVGWAGDDLCELDGSDAGFMWIHGTTMLEATPSPDGSVALRAYLGLGTRLQPGDEPVLTAILGQPSIGTYLIERGGDVSLVHDVPAHATPRNLRAAVGAVAVLADRLDDHLCSRLGGFRAWDMFRRQVLVALASAPPDADVL